MIRRIIYGDPVHEDTRRDDHFNDQTFYPSASEQEQPEHDIEDGDTPYSVCQSGQSQIKNDQRRVLDLHVENQQQVPGLRVTKGYSSTDVIVSLKSSDKVEDARSLGRERNKDSGLGWPNKDTLSSFGGNSSWYLYR